MFFSVFFGQFFLFDVVVDYGGFCYFGFFDRLVMEWEFECCQQCFCFCIGFCSGGDGDIYVMDCVDGVEVDFWEDDLFFYIYVEVVVVVEGMIGNIMEVVYVWQ